MKRIAKVGVLCFLVTLLLCTQLLVVGSASAAGEDDWPKFHHDLANSGYTTADAPDTNAVAWIYNSPSTVESSPAVVSGMLYVGGVNGILYALDAKDGDLIWAFTAAGPIHSSPAVEGGKVFFLDESGRVYALDAATGSPVWITLAGDGPYDWSSPAVHGGNVFIATSNGFLHSLNAGTGAINWSTNIGGSPNGMIAVVNGKVYSGTHNMNNNSPTLVALDEATGILVWKYDYFLFHGDIAGMINCNGVSVVGGKVYFGIYNWFGVGPQAIALDEATGTEIWAVSIGGDSTSTPAVHSGKVFLGSDDGKVYALNATTGAQVWSFQTGAQVWAAPAVADSKVYFGSLDHWFYAVNEQNGQLVWKYDTGASRLRSSPAVAYGKIFVGNESGKIYAFGPRFTKTAELVTDADGNGVPSPGDTIGYTATIKNVGTALTFSDTPDANTTLVVGSVTKTQGSVLKGNSPGDKSVEVFLGDIASGGQAVVAFKVTINSPMWEFFVANQAIVTASNFDPLKSDDPNTPQIGDPTVTNITMSPPVHGPGISQWGIVILVVLFGGAMVWVIRRRQIRSRIN